MHTVSSVKQRPQGLFITCAEADWCALLPIPIRLKETNMLQALLCPQCNLQFAPRRSNQKYCSDPCRKNGARGDRSTENRTRSMRHFERSQRLREALYVVPPGYRLGVMREILDQVPSDGGLRNILTDPALLSERPRADNRMNIARAASAYTEMFFGVSISTYVRKVRSGEKIEGIAIQQT